MSYYEALTKLQASTDAFSPREIAETLLNCRIHEYGTARLVGANRVMQQVDDFVPLKNLLDETIYANRIVTESTLHGKAYTEGWDRNKLMLAFDKHELPWPDSMDRPYEDDSKYPIVDAETDVDAAVLDPDDECFASGLDRALVIHRAASQRWIKEGRQGRPSTYIENIAKEFFHDLSDRDVALFRKICNWAPKTRKPQQKS